MLRDQYGLLVAGKPRNDLGRFAFESCHEFGSHAVILEWHFRSRNFFSNIANQRRLNRARKLLVRLPISDVLMVAGVRLDCSDNCCLKVKRSCKFQLKAGQGFGGLVYSAVFSSDTEAGQVR